MPRPLLQGTASGKLSVQEVTKEGLGGTAVGALIGALAGLPLGPLAVTIGAAGGALIGGSADLTNEGADTEFAEKISRELAPGKAAVVAEVDDDGVGRLRGADEVDRRYCRPQVMTFDF